MVRGLQARTTGEIAKTKAKVEVQNTEVESPDKEEAINTFHYSAFYYKRRKLKDFQIN